MLKIKSIEHIGIAVEDTHAEAKWYCDTLGFTVAYKAPTEPVNYFIKAPDGSCMIEFISASVMPESDPGRVDFPKVNPTQLHIAFEIEDFDAAYDALLAKGVKFEGPRPTGTGRKLAFFRDPEGIPLQLVYRPEPL